MKINLTSTRLKQAIIEFAAHGVLIYLAYATYVFLPYYKQLLQPQAKIVLFRLVIGYGILGIPYFILRTFIWKKLYENNVSKPLLLLRYVRKLPHKIYTLFTTGPQSRDFLDIFTMDEKTRVAIGSFVLKFIFSPIMLSFFLGHYVDMQLAVKSLFVSNSARFLFDNGYNVIINALFLIDTGIFLFGYLIEAKFLYNTIKSVDPYLSGWVVALICYPPFNNGMGNYLFSGKTGINWLFIHYPMMIVIKIATIICYAVYVWATLALWTKSSNLTNRGIVSRGPYKYIRHPAYIAKNCAWWLEQIPFMISWTNIFTLAGWNLIYILRALTEERHLMADPAYQEYAKTVKWRFIPKVI